MRAKDAKWVAICIMFLGVLLIMALTVVVMYDRHLIIGLKESNQYYREFNSNADDEIWRLEHELAKCKLGGEWPHMKGYTMVKGNKARKELIKNDRRHNTKNS